MKPWLNTKTAGLPRWAWVALAGGGVALGLYLRHRSAAKEAEASAESNESEVVPAEGEPVGYNAGEGGLAGAGLIGGPAGTTLTPVQTPEIPAGFTSAFEGLADQLGESNKYLLEHPSEHTEIIREAGGGGAPEPGSHLPPEPPNTPSHPAERAPSCSANDVNTLKSNKHEIERLQGEIQAKQNLIQAHPKAKERPAWEAEIASKRNTVGQLNAQSQKIRSNPACASVQV